MDARYYSQEMVRASGSIKQLDEAVVEIPRDVEKCMVRDAESLAGADVLVACHAVFVLSVANGGIPALRIIYRNKSDAA